MKLMKLRKTKLPPLNSKTNPTPHPNRPCRRVQFGERKGKRGVIHHIIQHLSSSSTPNDGGRENSMLSLSSYSSSSSPTTSSKFVFGGSAKEDVAIEGG